MRSMMQNKQLVRPIELTLAKEIVREDAQGARNAALYVH